MKNYLVGFSIAVIAAALFYFFYLLPLEKKKYLEGFNDAVKEIDTVFVPSEPIIEYREKQIYVEKPVIVEKTDTVIMRATSIDTTFISGKDEIKVSATVGMSFDLRTLANKAMWFMNIEHKDFVQLPDTMIVTVPKLITEVEYETNWFLIFISFISGGGIMALLALL